MPTPTSQVKLTYDDYRCFPEDGRRHEIIGGEHFVSASPFVRHQRLVLRLAYEIASHLDQQPVGEVLIAPCAVVLSEHDVVEPDLLFVSAERSHVVTEREVRGAPDLVIEVLSGSTRRTDEGVKRRLYERAGVREYWVVDPAAARIAVHRRGDAGLEPARSLTGEGDDTLTTPLLPGLAIPLRRLFR